MAEGDVDATLVSVARLCVDMRVCCGIVGGAVCRGVHGGSACLFDY